MKFDFAVLYGRSSAEVKRQLDQVVRDDAELLDETPGPYDATAVQRSRRSRRRAMRARFPRGAS